jgi:D-3-phosphoglycerate dehydrogenase / 2-oxoglutarate reductase
MFPLHHIRKFFPSSQQRTFARILATDKVDPLCISIFKSRGHEIDLIPTLSEEELIKIIPSYDGLVIRSATKVTSKILLASKSMRVIGRAGVGVDNIDISTATKCGIMVMNTPDGNTISTAQLTVSLLCNMARKIPQANSSIKDKQWNTKDYQGIELSGKTIGIIGCGRIGQLVAKLSQTLGMKVLGYDPILTTEELMNEQLSIEKSSLEKIYTQSDFITIHTPLTTDTRNLLNDETIKMCKKGVGIVNCARGGIVDEDALLRGLESGQVGMAALDVYTVEPPLASSSALLKHKNVVCTPHLGASTEEAQINVARDIAQQMCDVFDQKEV